MKGGKEDLCGISALFPVHLCFCVGILNGMSQLLLVLDQSEVRKIIKNCNGVREYIKVAEHVETLEEQATFAKNLTPGLTTTTRQVCPVQ